jgi:hypothetical protein
LEFPNEYFIEDREMSINLWELKRLSGLPKKGIPYEEYNPKDTVGSTPENTWQHSRSLKEVYQAYSSLYKKNKGVSFVDCAFIGI